MQNKREPVNYRSFPMTETPNHAFESVRAKERRAAQRER